MMIAPYQDLFQSLSLLQNQSLAGQLPVLNLIIYELFFDFHRHDRTLTSVLSARFIV